IRTEINAGFFSEPRAQELARRIPLQRFGRPEELVGAAIFLASDAASYVTGQVLTGDPRLSIALCTVPAATARRRGWRPSPRPCRRIRSPAGSGWADRA